MSVALQSVPVFATSILYVMQLIDYGLSEFVTKKKIKDKFGTPGYTAPEVLAIYDDGSAYVSIACKNLPRLVHICITNVKTLCLIF
jgi:serine/threonine protein kinase